MPRYPHSQAVHNLNSSQGQSKRKASLRLHNTTTKTSQIGILVLYTQSHPLSSTLQAGEGTEEGKESIKEGSQHTEKPDPTPRKRGRNTLPHRITNQIPGNKTRPSLTRHFS
ncbi:unnamed protein product [Periconia digitata]|uniref:Uncharacterized protein n=1 Tax=Periconia digitata TaxID=1303443 RepID=A0A9W4U4N9_9PLEO|nr:unnamed protein product [Periconia digitata]